MGEAAATSQVNTAQTLVTRLLITMYRQTISKDPMKSGNSRDLWITTAIVVTISNYYFYFYFFFSRKKKRGY